MKAWGFLSEEEKAELPKVNFNLLMRMAYYLKPYLFLLMLVLLIQILSSSISLVPQILSKSIVDDALLGKNMKLLLLLLGASIGFSVMDFLINNFTTFIRTEMKLKMEINLRNQLYDKLIHMDHVFFKSERIADIKDVITNDIASLIDSMLNVLPEVVSSIAVFITSFGVMGSIDYRMIIAGLAIFPLEVIPRRVLRKFNINNREQEREITVKQSHFLDETLSANGSLLVKLFTKEKESCDYYNELHQEKFKLNRIKQKKGNFIRLVLLILSRINSSLVYLVAGWLLIVKGNESISIGSISMCIALCTRLKGPVETMMNSKAELLRGVISFNRIKAYLDRENKIKNSQNKVTGNVCSGDIEFSHVDFSYEDNSPLIKNVDFKLPAGKSFAIVGPSGAGKSSVINLLPRLFDTTGGSITIGGVDIKEIDLNYLRNNIGVVTQECTLINSTIYENLRYAKPDATFDEIQEACKNANIHDYIMSTEKGYDSEVGVNGLKLSGGEKQRLAIARVLLKNPKILILDEATSALDSINEAEIQEALEKLLVGRTSIIIAHRLSTILKADNILVLNKGRIVEQGRHEDLIKLNGLYKELFDTQFRKVLEMEKKSD